MARYYVQMDPWDHTLFTAGSADTLFEAWVLDTRDKLRTLLDLDDLHTNWLVTDVAKWTGAGSAKGYCFSVHHMNATVADGPAWLFIIPGDNSSTTAEPEEILGSGVDATIAQYFYEIGGTTAFGTDGQWLVKYSATGGTTNKWDAGWDAVGALTGGDFDAPTTNPYSALNTFMPNTTQPEGLTHPDLGLTYGRWAVVFDDVKPCLTIYATQGRLNYARVVMLLGEIIDPYLGTDTYTTGAIGMTLTNDTNNAGLIVANSWHHYDASGTKVRTSFQRSSFFTIDNKVFASGDHAWDSVQVLDSTLVKGYLDTDLVKTVGEWNGDYAELFEFNGNVLLKVEQGMAFPYAINVPIFPAE